MGSDGLVADCTNILLKRRARALLRFDLSSITAVGAVVLGAQLRMFANYSYDPAPNERIYNANSLVTAPTASTTWQTKPASGAIVNTPLLKGSGWHIWEIMDLASSWIQSPAANTGVEVQAALETDIYSLKKYNSSEAGSNVPTLIVTFQGSPIAPNQPAPSQSESDFPLPEAEYLYPPLLPPLTVGTAESTAAENVMCAGFGFDPHTWTQPDITDISAGAFYGCTQRVASIKISICIMEYDYYAQMWIEYHCDKRPERDNASFYWRLDAICDVNVNPMRFSQKFRTHARAEVVLYDGRYGASSYSQDPRQWDYGGFVYKPECG